ncbi:hypothetical protein FRIGORI9N_400122 [Frigoribacterium sp. 9N]|nr:hypothetical protein FRIGORI9N_400122 [Frigoribacterium sp. 9N]
MLVDINQAANQLIVLRLPQRVPRCSTCRATSAHQDSLLPTPVKRLRDGGKAACVLGFPLGDADHGSVHAALHHIRQHLLSNERSKSPRSRHLDTLSATCASQPFSACSRKNPNRQAPSPPLQKQSVPVLQAFQRQHGSRPTHRELPNTNVFRESRHFDIRARSEYSENAACFHSECQASYRSSQQPVESVLLPGAAEGCLDGLAVVVLTAEVSATHGAPPGWHLPLEQGAAKREPRL